MLQWDIDIGEELVATILPKQIVLFYKRSYRFRLSSKRKKYVINKQLRLIATFFVVHMHWTQSYVTR